MSDLPPLQIKPASRAGVKALCGFYGKSGSGKTMSALLFARGLVGPKGRIALIDTESGRGSIFADLIPGGYQVIDLDAPFTPDRYADAIALAERSSDCTVVDSMSHEWAGEGGVLDMQEDELYRMAKDDYGKREACKMASWIKPKLAHKKMVHRLLRTKNPLICCLRGEEKTHMIKDGGKNKVVTDQFSSPLFDPRFIFEMLINFETISKNGEGGYVIPVKITHPSIKELLPKENEQIAERHGEALARWCAGTVTPTTASSSSPAESSQAPQQQSGAATSKKPIEATAATRTWMLEQLKDIHPKMHAYGIDKAIIMPTDGLEDWPLEKVPTSKPELAELRRKIEAHI